MLDFHVQVNGRIMLDGELSVDCMELDGGMDVKSTGVI